MSESRPQTREAAPDNVLLTEDRVRKAWTGPAGKMTPQHYASLFAEALAELLEKHLHLGAGAEGVEGTHVETLQSSTHFIDPLREGDEINVEARMLEWNPSHMRVFFTMWHGEQMAATCEQLLRNTSDTSGEAAPFPKAAGHAIENLYGNQEGLRLPRQAGQGVAMP